MKQLIFLLLFTSAIFAQSELTLLFDDNVDYQLQLPDTIYASTNNPVNVYWESIGLNVPRNINVSVSTDSGTVTDSCWTWTPVVEDTMDITFSFPGQLPISTTFVISSNDSLYIDRTFLAIGDSRLRDYNLAYLDTKAGDRLTYIGTQGDSPFFAEAYSGKTYTWFESDTASPFVYTTHFEFDAYLTNNSFDAPDYVVIRLGTNDVFGLTDANRVSSVSSILSRVDSLIDGIHSAGANTLIGLCLETPPADEETFLGSYPTSPTRELYHKNIHYFNQQLLAKYGDGGTRQLSYVSLIPLFPQCDPSNDFTNGVHENAAGYTKVFTMIFNWIKSRKHFEPTDVNNLLAWYDETGIVGTSDVTAWNDISGNNRHLAVTGASVENLTKVSSVNGYSGVRHSDYADTRRLVDTTNMTAPFTVYAVVNQETWTGKGFWDGLTYRSLLVYGITATPTITMRVGSAPRPQTSDLIVDSTMLVTCVYNANGSTSTIRVNAGSETTATDLPTVDIAGLTLMGGGAGGTQSANIILTEFLLYQGVHDATTQTKIRNYLNNKYKLY